MSKTFLFQTILSSRRTKFSSICLLDRTISCATTSAESGPGSDGNKGVLCIPQSSIITEASPSDCLMLYPGHSLEGSYSVQRYSQCILQPQPTGTVILRTLVWVSNPYAEMQSVCSATPADWSWSHWSTYWKILNGQFDIKLGQFPE